MRRKKQNHSEPCKVCGRFTDMRIVAIGHGNDFVCDSCFSDHRERHEDDGYMTEADYQTWGRF